MTDEDEEKVVVRRNTARKGVQRFSKKDGSPAAAAVSGAVLDQRIIEIQKCITKGLTSPEIHRFAKEKWNIEPATVNVYIRKAREKFADIPEEEWRAARGIILSQCNDLYKKSYAAEDYRTCLEILKYISKMFKLDGEEQKQPTIIINLEGGAIDEYD